MRGFLSDLAHDIEAGAERVVVEKKTENGINITNTTIGDNVVYNGITRRSGHYHAIDDIDSYREQNISQILSKYILRYIEGTRRIVVVGFGNDNYVSDRLGRDTIRNIDVDINDNISVVSIAPLVESITGMSSLDLVRSVQDKVKPDIIIAVDTLSTTNINRLGNSLQLTDAGINPGAGVSNAKGIISKESMGVPVLAIGVPLVISLGSIMAGYSGKMCYLVPSTIDSIVDRYSRIIGDGINDAISRI